MMSFKDITIGAVPPPASTVLTHVRSPNERLARAMVYEALPGMGTGILGAFLWKNHRVLGFFGGGHLGASVYPMINGEPVRALVGLGVGGAGVAGSLAWKNHPFWGYVLGSLGASALSAIIPSKYTERKL
jgi:hypothetical protein